MLRSAAEITKPGPTRDVLVRNRVFPDPVDYSEWFKRADVRRRRISVGAQRYKAGIEAAGKRPGYEVFIYPSGRFLSREQLVAETPLQRQERIRKVRAEVAHRRELIRATATFGFA